MKPPIAALVAVVAVLMLTVYLGDAGGWFGQASTTRPAGQASTAPGHGAGAAQTDLAPFVTGQLANFVPTVPRIAVPDQPFKDQAGEETMLSRFRGKVVLLNVWATWCAPCRRELPAIDRLQAQLGAADFEVIALSIDREGADKVAAFLAEFNRPLRNLKFYYDVRNRLGRAIGVIGMPTTLLIDRQGREAGRVSGPVEWDDRSAVTMVLQLLAEK